MKRIPTELVDDIIRLSDIIRSVNEMSLNDRGNVSAFERLKNEFKNENQLIRAVDGEYLDVNFRSISATIENIGDYAGCYLVKSSIEYCTD